MKSTLLTLLCIKFMTSVGLFAAQSAEEVFTHIYEEGRWGFNEEGKGFSGGGSTVQEAKPYMNFLQEFLIANEIKSVVDVGCGDWTFSQHIQWGEIQYTGFDVVKHVIEQNVIRFSKPTITFIHNDPTQLDLPFADLLLCKDVLQHLPLEDIAILLKQTYKFTHCLITNDVDPRTLTSRNTQILRGGYREVDLTKPPFNLKGVKVLTYPSGSNVKQILYLHN